MYFALRRKNFTRRMLFLFFDKFTTRAKVQAPKEHFLKTKKAFSDYYFFALLDKKVIPRACYMISGSISSYINFLYFALGYGKNLILERVLCSRFAPQGLFFLASRCARGNCWTGFFFLPSRFARTNWLEGLLFLSSRSARCNLWTNLLWSDLG